MERAKAIEAAARRGMGWDNPRVDEQWQDLISGNGSDYQVERCRVAMASAEAAASAIDGDFNAGIEACQEYLRSIHHTNTADMLEKLKR